ncbi:MAG: hypothetical protein ACR2JW_02395 [Thermomicrobiales bacterium]
MWKKLQRPETIVWIVVAAIAAIVSITIITVPPWPLGRPTRDEATVWITALTGCGTIAAVAVAGWAAWQSQRAADGTQRTADLMNHQWNEQRREQRHEKNQRQLSALRAVRMEVASTLALCRKSSILLHPLGTWAYCREEVANIFPETAAFIDHLNHDLLTIERRVDALSIHSLQPQRPATGGISSAPMGGVTAIAGYIQKITPELDEAVKMLDAHLAQIEQDQEAKTGESEVTVK